MSSSLEEEIRFKLEQFKKSQFNSANNLQNTISLSINSGESGSNIILEEVDFEKTITKKTVLKIDGVVIVVDANKSAPMERAIPKIKSVRDSILELILLF